MVEGSCTRGSCRLFGGSTSGYLQMKGHKCGTVEESGGKEWPGEIAGMSKFILEESKGGEEIEKVRAWARRKGWLWRRWCRTDSRRGGCW